jgi:hypothetical protein
MLDDLELIQVQEIATFDRRHLAEHKPPGMDGSILQNLGRQPATILLRGVVTGPETKDFVDKLNEKFRAGKPVPFVANIVADSRIEKVQIDDLRLEELAGKPERVAYVLTMREHIEPAAAEDVSGLQTDILEDAQALMDGLPEGLDLGLDFASGLERFVGPLGDLLGRLRKFREDLERAPGA